MLALAQAPPDDVRRAVENVVREVAAGQPAEAQRALTIYLARIPDSIRQSLRRPADPGGTTAPMDFSVSCPEDLVRLLPARLPRFKPGDRPLPGVDWELEELVGVGGFGEVWKARHAHLQSKPPVALKFCLDKAAAAALRNEAGILDRVMQHGRHPGIVPLLNTYLSADPPCLEYEFVEGGDLARLIQELHAQKQMTPDLANRLAVRLSEIVGSTHRADPPIVHGDIKPANVLARRAADGRFTLRVTDFGIGGLAVAKAARETRGPTRSRQELLTEAVRGAYTPLYASPEQMRRRPGEAADPRDDVHALGVIWYQLLTGNLEMISIPSDWREQVQKCGLNYQLAQLLGACLAPKAENRPAHAAALAEALKAAFPRDTVCPAPEGENKSPPGSGATPDSETATVGSPPKANPKAGGWARSWRVKLLCIGSGIGLLVPFLIVVSFSNWSSNRGNEAPPPTDLKNTPPWTPSPDKPKELQWTHGFELACRKLGEDKFTKDTQKFGIEALRDKNNDLGLYVSQTGSMAVVAEGFAGLTAPMPKSAGPKWLTGLDLPARKAGEKAFTKDTKVHNMEGFLDPNTNVWLYVTVNGSIAATPSKKKAAGASGAPKWIHSVDLSVRKGGVKDWMGAAKFGVEVYRDTNTGNLIFVCETGSIAVAPEIVAIKGDVKAPDWLHGLDLSCRKHDEKAFTDVTRRYGVEVFNDSTTEQLIVICETGAIAVAPAGKGLKAPTANVMEPRWTHGLTVKARKYGEKDFTNKTTIYGTEVFRDENVGMTLFVCETGYISAAPIK